MIPDISSFANIYTNLWKILLKNEDSTILKNLFSNEFLIKWKQLPIIITKRFDNYFIITYLSELGKVKLQTDDSNGTWLTDSRIVEQDQMDIFQTFRDSPSEKHIISPFILLLSLYILILYPVSS